MSYRAELTAKLDEYQRQLREGLTMLDFESWARRRAKAAAEAPSEAESAPQAEAEAKESE